MKETKKVGPRKINKKAKNGGKLYKENMFFQTKLFMKDGILSNLEFVR